MGWPRVGVQSGLFDPRLLDPGLLDASLLNPGLSDPSLLDPGLLDARLVSSSLLHPRFRQPGPLGPGQAVADAVSRDVEPVVDPVLDQRPVGDRHVACRAIEAHLDPVARPLQVLALRFRGERSREENEPKPHQGGESCLHVDLLGRLSSGGRPGAGQSAGVPEDSWAAAVRRMPPWL